MADTARGADVHGDVRAAAGSRAAGPSPAYDVPHGWTDAGIAVEGGGAGAHLLLTVVAEVPRVLRGGVTAVRR